MMCRNSLAVLTAAATLSLGGLAFGQNNPVQTEPPRDTNSGRAGINTAPNAADRAANSNEAAEAIRKLANDPMAGDKLFVMMASCGNQWEVAVSKLAAEKSTNQDIKDAANMIVKDHQMAQQKLEPIAARHGVKLDSSLKPEQQALLDVLRSMPADKLESAWLQCMRADHAMAITSYGDHTKTLQNEELRAYASEVLPKLRQHSADINRIAATRGFTNDAATNTGPAPTMNH